MARFYALALLCQLLLVMAIATAVVAACALHSWAIAPIALGTLCAVALLTAVAPLVLARPSRGGPGRRAVSLLRALCIEAAIMEIDVMRMAVEPCRAPLDSGGAWDAASPRPVLLVHGFACNRAVWRPALQRLRAERVGPLRAVSLEPVFAGLDTVAAAVLSELESLAGSSGRPVAIIAHSMGGLVARAALRRARPGLIDRIVTIGTPHHGTALACRFCWPNATQMRPASGWLEDLNASQEGKLGTHITSIYSRDDNFISPPDSCRLRGALELELGGIGHFCLLHSPQVLERVVSELRA